MPLINRLGEFDGKPVFVVEHVITTDENGIPDGVQRVIEDGPAMLHIDPSLRQWLGLPPLPEDDE